MKCTWCEKKLKGKQTKFCSMPCKISRWRSDTKKWAVELLGGKCIRCGYDRCVAALLFHHARTGKTFGISQSGATRSRARVRRELEKCDLLCLNCHAEAHFIPR